MIGKRAKETPVGNMPVDRIAVREKAAGQRSYK